MWWTSRATRPPADLAVCQLLGRATPFKPFLVAARSDTDYTIGAGQVAITGRYDSKKESLAVDAAYAADDNNTLHATYAVTDEKVLTLGLETGFIAAGRRATFDMAYHPPRDSATLKLSVRQGKTRLASTVSFDDVRDNRLAKHSERYQLDARLSGVESLKMAFDARSKAAKVKVSRKLDPKNKLDAEYNYITSNEKSVLLTFNHHYSKVHTFSVAVNYGAKKYNVEWDCKTDNGPWTVSSSFPFNASPHRGDWQIKRRFEF